MIENVRSLAFDTIQDILNEGAYSNLRINEVLSENELNAWIRLYLQKLSTEPLKENLR